LRKHVFIKEERKIMTLKTNQSRGGQTSMGAAYAEASQRQPGAQTGAETTQGMPREGAVSPETFSIRQMSALFELPAAANTQSEVLAKARSVLEADVKAVPDQQFDIKIIGLDRENPALHIGVSVIVIGVSVRQNQNYGMGYHVLLLAASAPEPGTQTFQYAQNRTVEVKQVVGDAWDDIMRTEVNKELQRMFPNVPLYSGEARVVHTNFNWDDQTRVKTLRAEVVTAAAMALAKSLPDFKDVNLKRIEVDNTLSLTTQFKQPQITDSTGLPIRADIRITFKAGQTQRNPNQLQSPNTEKPQEITSIAGYMDLIHIRQAAANPYLAPQQQVEYDPATGRPVPVRPFIPRFVITRLRSGRAATLSQQLLGLVTVFTLRKPGAYYPQFKPDYGVQNNDGIDLRDVGALGLVMVNPQTGAPVGRIPTKQDTFRESDLGILLHSACRAGLVVSMDIDECGDDTWMNAPFAEAAQTVNPAKRQAATELLFDSMNYLTAGKLANHFQRGAEICFNENNRIINGYYTGRGGALCDARDLDELAMLNLMGERDMKVVTDWEDTYLRSEFPLEQRLDARLETMKNLMPDLKVTGMSTRVTFTDAFLKASTKAVAETGLTIKEVSAWAGMQGFDAPTYQFAGVALGGYEATNLFQAAGGGGMGTSYTGGTGRWR